LGRDQREKIMEMKVLTQKKIMKLGIGPLTYLGSRRETLPINNQSKR